MNTRPVSTQPFVKYWRQLQQTRTDPATVFSDQVTSLNGLQFDFVTNPIPAFTYNPRGVFSVSASASRASAKQMMSQYLLNSQTVWEVFLPFLETNDLFLKLTYEYVEISLQQQPSLIQLLEQNSSSF